ncbi:hypothetical protein EV401DRAFT_2074497 [Pisolithus croceorrhizus]|nr:hypothetical protein EV401DRAFT_2074497 [Pisolithus croceorrhizus]
MTAIALHPIVSKITIKHPLGSSQLSSLRLAGSTAGVPTFYHASRRKRHANVLHHRSSRLVFCAVILLSQPSTHIIHVGVPLRIVRSLYIDPPPPGLSRASSVSRSFTDREGMPTPMPCLSGSPSIARNASRTQLSASPTFNLVNINEGYVASALSVVQERRRIVDFCYHNARRGVATVTCTFVLGEQKISLGSTRSYCVYVVRSTVVPSLPSATTIGTSNVSDNGGGLVEGWRAMLTVVQWHKLSQRQRMSRFVAGCEGAEGARDEELEGVEAMMAGVKSKGGKDLSKYMRGLLM